MALLATGGSARAQDAGTPNASFEASLKRFCPAKNLEFLKPDVLAKTADAFVNSLPKDEGDRVRNLAKPGVEACAGAADDSCRTAALLGTIRFTGLSEPLAERFCALPITCQDWFVCTETADGPAAVPAPQRQEQASAAPQPEAEPVLPPERPSASRDVPPEEDMDEDLGETAAPQPLPEPRGPVARAPLPPPPELATPTPDPSSVPPPAPAEAPSSGQRTARAEPPADARAVVVGFYSALGRGDGIDAARFLIPEKRGRGPFSASAMQRFYGNLRRPLRLSGIEELGPSRVRARYTFMTQAGAVCVGDAVVAVANTREGPLIQSIRALSGC